MFKKIKMPHIDWLPLILISIILYKLINNIHIVANGFNIVFSSIAAIFWGFILAYLMNPLMMFIENKFKTKRNLSILIVYIIVVGAIIILITTISPRIAHSAKELYDNVPTYINKVDDWFNNTVNALNEIKSFEFEENVKQAFNSILDSIANFFDEENLKAGLSSAFTKAVDVTSSIIKVIFGFIVSIYILKDKEIFIRNVKKFTYAVFKKDTADAFINFNKEVDLIFSKYIIGKFIDSLIIGFICFLGLALFKIPFASLISLVIGITNMIPYFGPIIGMIPAVILTLLSDPVKALIVFVFILALQQFDGWFLGPKILGDQVGLSPFLIIVAILLGGAIFGVWGMFLGAPIMAVIKVFLERFVNKKLSDKNVRV